nr:MAG TPA: PolyVal ADP-Ribosyltransferase [Phage sp. ctucZ11]
MAMQTGGGTARDRIMARARALDDEEKKKQQAQQPQQTRQSARTQVPMRYRQTAQEPGQEAAQQPQTTARDRIQARARAMGQQRVMSGLGDLTVEEYQYALKQAEKSIAQQDDRFGSDRAKETYKKALLALSPVVSPVWTGVLALTDFGKNVQEREAAAASKTAKWLFGKSQKTPEEIVAEQQEAQAAARRREELASLDLAEYERLLEQAKKEAAGQQPKYNIHAMGGYDPAAENTEARKKADDMQRTYNQAKQVQYERQGLEALGKLNRKQLAAVETLVETPETGTAVMSARVAQDSRRKQATDTLKAAGYSDTEIGELVTWRSRQKDQEAYQKNVQWHENLADSGAAGAAAATVLSVPENLLSGLGAADLAMQNAQKLGGVDHPANYYTPAMRLYGGSNAARTTVSEKLERSTDATIFGQNVASVAYNIGTSMMDSGATAALAAIGVPPMVGSAFLGGSAATAAMVDAKERGIDDTNALWTGLFAGVAETLFEDVSLERLLTLKPAQGTLAKRLQTTMKNVGLQAATEGSEELFTSFANYITDRAINGGLSEYGTAVRAYMDQGMSHQTATAKASADLAGQMAMDFVAGGIAGGLMAGGKSAIDVGQQNRAVLQFGELAGTAAEDRLSADGKDRLAQKVKSRTEQGETVSGGALREVMERTIEARNKETRENVRQRAQARLEELGDPNAESVSRAVAQLYDSNMSRAREERARQTLRNSKYGQQVANELEEAMGRRERTEDADQGATAAWAENLPRYTSRGEYISELQRKRVNPQATDRRPVTGYKYNAETGQLDAIVKGEDGKTETIPKERAATTGQQEMLAYLAADLKEGAPAMIASYLDGQDLETYSRQWHNAYEYGAANVKRDYAMASQAVDQLNETQRGIAYDTGKAVYDQRMAQERQKFPQESKGAAITREGTVSLKGATVGGVTYAPVTQEAMTRRQRDSVEVMRQLARVSGVDVVFYQSRANGQGRYTEANGFYRDGTVYLDINAGKNAVGDLSETAVLLTAAHELTHFIQEYSPAQYEQLRDFVVERLTEAEDVDLDALVQRHQKDQPELSYDEALDEVVADGCQMMLKDSQAAAALAKQNRSLAGNIRSWLRKWVKRLQEAFRGLTARSREAQALTRYAKELQKIWDDALIGAARNLQQSEAETSDGAIVWDDSLIHDTSGDDGVWGDNLHQQSDPATGAPAAQVRYEVRESKDETVSGIKEQIRRNAKALEAMEPVGSAMVSGIERMTIAQKRQWAETILRPTGYKVDRQGFGSIYFEPRHINQGLNYLKQDGEIAAFTMLPKVLKRGIVIESRENHKGRNFGTVTIAAPVEINGIRGNMAAVVQLTGKNHYHTHRIIMPDGSAFAFNAEKNTESKPAGALLQKSTHATPIESVSKHSIRHENEKSNTKFSVRDNTGRELTPAQQEYFRGSKARDENGNLLVMYHQTDGNFTVFDTEHKGAGTGDDETPFGVFLKKTSRDIGVRGKKQMQLYANIQNPLRVDNREQLVQSLARMSEEYASLKAESGNIDKEYGAKFEKAKRAFVDFLTRWRKENPDAPARAAYNAEGFDAAFNAEDEVVEEWTRKKDEIAVLAKKAITNALRANGYDGVFLENDKGSWGRSTEAYIALDANQVKNVDNQNPTTDPDIRFSVREAKITDRELLANALETTARNDLERGLLAQYQEKAKSAARWERWLDYHQQKLADHESGVHPLTTQQVLLAREKAAQYAEMLDQLDEKLLKIESMGPMRKLLERERSYVDDLLTGAVAAEKEHFQADFEQRLQEARRREQESLAQYRERREESERRRAVTAKIERTTRQLADRLNTNTDKKHIPEPLKKPVAQLLTALDYSSRSSLRGDRATRADQEYCRAMEGIRRVLADQEAFQQGTEGSEDALGGYLDLPPGLTDLMTKHIQTVENIIEDRMPTETVLRRMNLTQLRDLDVILSTVTRAVAKMNELLENRTFVRVADAAEDTMAELHRRGQYKGAAEKAETFVAWDNTLPWYAFQRFGEGGRAIFGELQDGWDKLAFNSKQVLDFRKSVITDEQARAWDTEVRRVELLDQEGETVTVSMTTAQLMGLYCLSKRKQALGHLFGGGIRITDIETRGKLRKKTIKQDEHYKMDDQMLGRLLGQLTPEQIAVADKLQKYMTEQGSKWGNEVTMKRFGYRGFTEKIYYPIETDSQDRLSRAGDGTEGSLYRLQNISAVKPLVQNANNAIMLRGIFDVFSNHMADMAKYNALVIPIVDAQKWYNYKDSTKNETGQVNTQTVQRAMTKAYGQSANRYVVQFLKDLNGVKESGARGEAFADKMISNYKRAAVAANLRVALLQPTAYVRAAAVLDYKYLAKAFGDRTGTRQATAEMLEHSGIALWKDMGFFDTDVGRSIRDQIKGKGSRLEDLVDKSMAAAELGDKVTWARLWRACKLETQEKQGLSGDELVKATARRFRDVIYQTQVIDSTMTRSHMMRSSSTFSKMFTSFMSEPTVSYNLIMEGTRQILKDKKAMGLKTAIGRNWKTAGRAYQAYVVSALAAAVVESLADALRDDDDDTLWEKLWNAFGGLRGNLASDLNPLNKLPYMRDVFSALDGYDNGRMDTEGLANAKKAYDILMESYRLATGQQDKATSTTYYGNMTTYGKVYQTFRAVSMLSGLPLSAATREVITTWNNTVGSVWPGMKRKTYESKKLREAYNSYAKPADISYDKLSTAMEYVATLESDKDAEGKTVSGSLKAKYVAYIQSMGLTPSQQKAMWLALKISTWSDKGTPWE